MIRTTLIATDRWTDRLGQGFEGQLRLTCGGAFFTIERRLDADEEDPRSDWAFDPVNRDAAERWVMQECRAAR